MRKGKGNGKKGGKDGGRDSGGSGKEKLEIKDDKAEKDKTDQGDGVPSMPLSASEPAEVAKAPQDKDKDNDIPAMFCPPVPGQQAERPQKAFSQNPRGEQNNKRGMGKKPQVQSDACIHC